MRISFTKLLLVFTFFFEIVAAKLTCEQNYIYHKKEDRCCKHIRCSKNYEVTVCNKNYSSDWCKKCSGVLTTYTNYSSFDLINRPGLKQCANGCNPESIKIFEEGKEKCVCDVSRNYYGKNTENCQHTLLNCGVGEQLSRESEFKGKCEPCAKGTFKDWHGEGLCISETNCSMLMLEYKRKSNATSDAECNPLKPVALTKKVLVSISWSGTITIILCIVAVVFVIMIILVLTFLFKYCQKRKNNIGTDASTYESINKLDSLSETQSSNTEGGDNEDVEADELTFEETDLKQPGGKTNPGLLNFPSLVLPAQMQQTVPKIGNIYSDPMQQRQLPSPPVAIVHPTSMMCMQPSDGALQMMSGLPSEDSYGAVVIVV